MAGRDYIGRGVLALLGATVILALAAAPSTAMTHTVDHSKGGADYGRAAAGYWTKQRMQNATPLDRTLPAPPAAADSSGNLRAAPPSGSGGNASGTIAPQLPDPSARRAARIHAPKYQAGPVPAAFYEHFPFSAIGKLYFTLRGDKYVCSASSVASKSRSTVLTAGHCVHDKQMGWASNVAFVPAYRSGDAPYGIWPAMLAVAPRGWIRHEHYSQDYAVLKVVRSPFGRLSKIVGGIGVAWGQPRKQHYYALGYPNNRGYGQLMYGCRSRSAGKDPFFRGPGQPDTGIGCDMSHGASGGGWLISKRNNGKEHPFVNSVTSYGYNARPNLLFGPYFTKRVRGIVRAASRR